MLLCLQRMLGLTPWKTVQITIGESLLAEVQQATKALQVTRSDFFKLALERALRQRKIIELESRDAKAYAAVITELAILSSP